MALMPANHQYGPAEVGGNALVHQGDKHVQNTYYIRKAVFPRAAELLLSDEGATMSRKRRRSDDGESSDRCACGSKRTRVVERNAEGASKLFYGPTQAAATLLRPSKRCLQADQGEWHEKEQAVKRAEYAHNTDEVDGTLEDALMMEGSKQRLCPDYCSLPSTRHSRPRKRTISDLPSLNGQSERAQQGFFLAVLETCRLVLCSPALTRTLPFMTPRRPVSELELPREEHQGMVVAHGTGANKPTHELGAICIFLLSCLTIRNVSTEDVTKILAKCKGDGMLPFLTWLFGLSIARYIYAGSVSRSLTELTGDCIILEDAFQHQRRVPMSTCEHFTILRAFLEVHYQGRAGEPMVRAGQFNMTLGSRRGLVIRPSDWSRSGRIRAGAQVVMSIYVRSENARCTVCQSSMTVTPMGDFFCNTCERFFRDCDTLRYLPEKVERTVSQKPSGPVHRRERLVPTSGTTDSSEDASADDDEHDYDVTGLRHIDLRIVLRS